MVDKLTSVRDINKTCDQAAQGKQKNVYCTLPEGTDGIRVIRARSVLGVLQVRVAPGKWVEPAEVYQN